MYIYMCVCVCVNIYKVQHRLGPKYDRLWSSIWTPCKPEEYNFGDQSRGLPHLEYSTTKSYWLSCDLKWSLINCPSDHIPFCSFIQAVCYVKSDYITDTYMQKFGILSFTNYLL